MTRRSLRRSIRCIGPVLATVALAALGCTERPAQDDSPPDIVLVTLDTTRADHLGAYGYFRDTSPAFDAMAGESLLFERYIVPMATTLPTHVSLLTSSHPMEHGVLSNVQHGGRPFVPTQGLASFAAAAERAGYARAAFVSAAPLKAGTGIESGFEIFDEPADKTRRGDATTDAALGWLASADARPRFLWVHYYDAHWPFEAPAPYADLYGQEPGLDAFIAERKIAASAQRLFDAQGRPVGAPDDARRSANAYDGELRFQDAQLARLLDALKASPRWQRTALVIAGDHGEGLCQHGEPAHGGTWNEQLHAPLLMRIPGEAPRRVDIPLTASDVLATLVGRLTLPESLAAFGSDGSGQDVLAPGAQPGAILSQDTGRQRHKPFRYSLDRAGWKYFRIEQGDEVREELYDRGVDPFELHDVSETHAEMLASLRAEMDVLVQRYSARGLELRGGEEVSTTPADPELLEQLRALGYLDDSGESDPPDDAADSPDPSEPSR